MSIFSVFQFLMAPVWGRLSDRFGRKSILLICMAGEAISYVFFAYSENLTQLYLARALSGFFGGSISTASALMSDISKPEERSKSMALIGMAFGLGFVIGPSIGGLIGYIQNGAAEQAMQLSTFFIVALCLINLVFTSLMIKETGKSLNGPKPGRLTLISKSMQNSPLRELLLATLLGVTAMAAMEATLVLWMQDKFSWSITQTSFGFAYVGLVGAIWQGYFVRKLLPKFGERRLLFWGFALFGTALILIPMTSNVYTLAAILTFFSFGHGLINPSLIGAISLANPENQQGEGMGIYQSASSLGRIFGPLVGGGLYQAHFFGFNFYGASFWGAGILGLLPIYLLYRVKSKIPNKALAAQNNLSTAPRGQLNELFYFQLNNLIEGRIPFKFVQLSTNIEKNYGVLESSHIKTNSVYLDSANSGDSVVKSIIQEFPNKETAFVILCQQGDKSKGIANNLEKVGYLNVYFVSGGLLQFEGDRQNARSI